MTSAVDDLGPHLLKRLPSKPDDRNYPLSFFLTEDPLRAALAAMKRSPFVAHSVKTWASLATDVIDPVTPTPPSPTPPGPSPDPTPTPPTASSWLDNDDPVLDQGQTGHCVGFTGADWENALPVDDHLANAAGDEIYYQCKVVDGEPGQEDGSTIHSLAKVLVQRGRLKTYAFANTIDEVFTFVQYHGPICLGIGWTQSMFTPDADGIIVPKGSDVGGHALIQYGVDGDYALILNHWGTSWGIGGKCKMHKSDLAERLANGGEAMAGVELP